MQDKKTKTKIFVIFTFAKREKRTKRERKIN